jgi:uncharacterized membrane protein
MISPRRHAPFYIAVVSGLVALPLVLWLKPQWAVQATANIFFLVYLTLEFAKIHSLTPAFLKKHAASADEPVWVIFIVTFSAVLVAVSSLFVLINKGGKPNGVELGLSLASVAFGWLTIHTMAALHYAHLYWRPDAPAGSEKTKATKQREGLEFPGDNEPGGYDFLYFSLVTGMTAQTSDVDITSTEMRKLNVLHAVVSFFFNTVLVAAAVNVAVSLAD